MKKKGPKNFPAVTNEFANVKLMHRNCVIPQSQSFVKEGNFTARMSVIDCEQKGAKDSPKISGKQELD